MIGSAVTGSALVLVGVSLVSGELVGLLLERCFSVGFGSEPLSPDCLASGLVSLVNNFSSGMDQLWVAFKDDGNFTGVGSSGREISCTSRLSPWKISIFQICFDGWSPTSDTAGLVSPFTSLRIALFGLEVEGVEVSVEETVLMDLLLVGSSASPSIWFDNIVIASSVRSPASASVLSVLPRSAN